MQVMMCFATAKGKGFISVWQTSDEINAKELLLLAIYTPMTTLHRTIRYLLKNHHRLGLEGLE